MLEPLLLAFIIGYVRKQNIKNLFKRWEFYPLLIMVFVYIVFQVTIFMDIYYFIRFTALLKYGFLASLVIIIFRNKLYNSYLTAGGLLLYIAGSIMNRAAVSANDGRMPVFPGLSLSTGYTDLNFLHSNNMYVLGDESTRLKWLADIYDVGYSIMSLGDILIRAFAFIILLLFINSIGNSRRMELAA